MPFNIKSVYTILLVSCFTLMSCGDDDSVNSTSNLNYSSNDSISVESSTNTSSALSTNEGVDAMEINEEPTTTIEVVEESVIADVPTEIGDLPVESDPVENENVVTSTEDWVAAKGWTNMTVNRTMEGVAEISFNVRAKSNNINGVVAVTYGPANEYDDLALIFRMFRNGYIDARDGDTYESDMTLSYEANEIYFVEMYADFNSKLYDVFVTYPSGQRFPVRLSAEFRTTQPISVANQLVIYEANQDALEITNFKVNNNDAGLDDTPDNTSVENVNAGSEGNSMPLADVPAPVIDLSQQTPISIEVNTSSELDSALDSAINGGIIYLRDGNYDCVDLSNRLHTLQAPLVIQGISNNAVIDGNCSYTINVNQSSYIAIRNVVVIGGLDGIRVRSSNNIIIDDVDVSMTRQAGIHIGVNSSDIDVVNSVIYDTGTQNPQWGECIYVGTGTSQNFPDETVRVWIENNTIRNCGFSEAINIKPEVFHSTVRGNRISNIQPGSARYSQFNQAAITIEGGRGSNPSNNHRPNDPREVWVENNTISNVAGGRWNNGLMVGGTGVYVNANNFSNVEESAIFVNTYGNLDLPVYHFGNIYNENVNRNLRGSSRVDIIEQEHDNPNSPQNWLP